MSSSLNNDNYLDALQKAALFQDKVGLTTYIASSQADQVMIRQNNTIIELLVALHIKLDNISKTTKEKSDIERLTEQMANLKAIDPKKHITSLIVFEIPEYKFGHRINKK